MNKILISGGWGYGNIGDDALLDATIRLFEKNFPEIPYLLTTYDMSFTKNAGLQLTGGLQPSVHRLLKGRDAFWDFPAVGRSFNIYCCPYYLRRVCERFIIPPIRRVMRSLHHLSKNDSENMFKNVDLFFMSGGGYFNSWGSMFETRIKEVGLARKYGCKIVCFGQSMGPFTYKQKEILKNTFTRDDVFYVRDGDSAAEIESFGFKVGLIPDLAMGIVHRVDIRKGEICVVPAELTTTQAKILADELSYFKDHHIVLTLTRMIHQDVLTLKLLYRELQSRKINVALKIPGNYIDLLTILEGSEWIVSRGLHAMILGWRSGSNVFALTTSRKVDGFLKTIRQDKRDYQCAERDWMGRLHEILAHAMKSDAVWDEQLHVSIARSIESAFVKAVGI